MDPIQRPGRVGSGFPDGDRNRLRRQRHEWGLGDGPHDSTSADAILNIINNSRFTAEEGTSSGANNGTIQVSDTSVFNVAGTINNNGSIELLGSGAGASLVLLGDTTLNGGALSLSGNGENFIIGGGTLTNANNSDISGAGQIDGAVVNKALIDATSNSAVL